MECKTIAFSSRIRVYSADKYLRGECNCFTLHLFPHECYAEKEHMSQPRHLTYFIAVEKPHNVSKYPRMHNFLGMS